MYSAVMNSNCELLNYVNYFLDSFSSLHSLTALNLERNLLQDLPHNAFRGVMDTLGSLSLLNNLLTQFPVNAINSLKYLRVSVFYVQVNEPWMHQQ